MTRPHPIPDDRIRERAYRLWLEEGQPQRRSAEHWEKARELLALESDPEEGKEGVGEGTTIRDPGVSRWKRRACSRIRASSPPRPIKASRRSRRSAVPM